MAENKISIDPKLLTKKFLEEIPDEETLVTVQPIGHGHRFGITFLNSLTALYNTQLAKYFSDMVPNNPRLLITNICFGYNFFEPSVNTPETVAVAGSSKGRPQFGKEFLHEFMSQLGKTGKVYTSFETTSRYLSGLPNKNDFEEPTLIYYENGQVKTISY